MALMMVHTRIKAALAKKQQPFALSLDVKLTDLVRYITGIEHNDMYFDN